MISNASKTTRGPTGSRIGIFRPVHRRMAQIERRAGCDKVEHAELQAEKNPLRRRARRPWEEVDRALFGLNLPRKRGFAVQVWIYSPIIAGFFVCIAATFSRAAGLGTLAFVINLAMWRTARDPNAQAAAVTENKATPAQLSSLFAGISEWLVVSSQARHRVTAVAHRRQSRRYRGPCGR